MDIDSVRNLTDTELLGELVTQRRALYDLRFQLATRQLTDHSQLTQTRRSIARVTMYLHSALRSSTASPTIVSTSGLYRSSSSRAQALPSTFRPNLRRLANASMRSFLFRRVGFESTARSIWARTSRSSRSPLASWCFRTSIRM